MTFPDRNQGGSGVYARSVVAALKERGEVEVTEIRSVKPGLLNTTTWLARNAGREVAAHGAQVLHCPNFVAPWRAGVPTVITIFDLSTRRFPRDHPAEWRAYERWFLPSRARSAARVIAISELTRQDAIHEYGIRPESIVTIHLGVHRRFFETPDAVRPAERAEPRLLFPGAPVARKNLDLVLTALSTAPPESALARACLQISGAVADRFPHHLERIKSLGLSGRVEWLGAVPVDQMPNLMRAADVCAYPSFYEGFGFPPLEAMASGTPVVASNASCLPEILGDAALMVDPSDVGAFTRAVESTLTNQELRGKLIDAGRRRAREFTWERCAEQTSAVYRDVLGRGQ